MIDNLSALMTAQGYGVSCDGLGETWQLYKERCEAGQLSGVTLQVITNMEGSLFCEAARPALPAVVVIGIDKSGRWIDPVVAPAISEADEQELLPVLADPELMKQVGFEGPHDTDDWHTLYNECR